MSGMAPEEEKPRERRKHKQKNKTKRKRGREDDGDEDRPAAVQARIRSKTQKNLKDIIESKVEASTPGNTKLVTLLARGRALSEVISIKEPRTGAIDAEAMSELAGVGRAKVENLRTDFTRMDPAAFATEVRKMFGTVVDMARLGETFGKFLRTVPKLDLMYGPVCTGSQIRRRVARRPRGTVTEARQRMDAAEPQLLQQVRPDTDVQMETREDNETMQEMLQLLLDFDRPVSLYQLVINPTSYAQTVENMFYTSFLTKMGSLHIWVDDETSVPMVKSMQAGNRGKASERASRRQAILNIDYELWRQLKAELGDEPPLMNDRGSG
ncbi:uncharacterized protein AMSG_07017 [Thecamonas trahens ATCC 50062]|uniref:Non-structural maintenance of chromosomes element 4 n=1 Tax=Thecamonas trahens ATCC 50062 TaxID=461836 RepID=A0A0L0DFG8_THETB|nr:hypothetical protein AMSG_07017 [Thecamonas trahens ATCC 50062]KNC51039.1 hypothetical protein AMSG_07017 [Thecamonas trahens ATCC 50062]|eukprot:XP_013756506.1 hypothetical protein AMSG_07017 [Thecamonas trahens ATCC 50062]